VILKISPLNLDNNTIQVHSHIYRHTG